MECVLLGSFGNLSIPSGKRVVDQEGTESQCQRYYSDTHRVHEVDYRALIVGTRIQTWALEEARRRLEAEGILPDPDDEAKKQT